MARTARTSAASAPAPSANGSDDDDDRSGDAEETEEANEDTSDHDPDPDPESGPEAGPKEEHVNSWTIKRKLTRDYYENVIGLNKTASFALFVDQDMTKMRDFLCIKPKNIEKICTAIMKQNKSTIPVMAMERTTLVRPGKIDKPNRTRLVA